MDIVNPSIQAYAEKYTSEEDELLKEVADFTRRHPESHMMSGQLQGKVLEMISCMVRPRRVLEIGTFTGYSALCLAKGLTDDGILHTIELRKQEADTAAGFFKRSAFAGRMIQHTGVAADIIPFLNEIWDIVFIDADKPGYTAYFNLVFPHVRKNGFILADNIFFHGKVLQDEKGKSAKGISEFNEMIGKRHDIEKAVLTLRDGLYIIRKL